MQETVKVTKICQSERVLGIFSLQTSSCIHSRPKIVNFCRKVETFVGGHEELTWVTLL